MKPSLFFVTGVPGIGKTSIIGHLKGLLGDRYEVHDFDERGVPDNVSVRWRMREMAHWTKESVDNGRRGISTVVCGNVMPSEASAEVESAFICLDATDEKLRERLEGRYKDPKSVEDLKRMTGLTPEESVRVNLRNAPPLRRECESRSIPTVDTSDIPPEKVAEKVAEFIRAKSK